MDLGLLTTPVIWEKNPISAVKDAWGQIATPETETILVAWQASNKVVINQKGEEVVSNVRMFTDKNIGYDDVFTFEGIRYPVKAKGTIRGFDGGITHYEVSL